MSKKSTIPDSLYNVESENLKKGDIKLFEEKPYTARAKLFEHSESDRDTLKFLQTRHREMNQARPDEDWDLRYKQFLSALTWKEDGTANINLPVEYATIENKMADELSLKPIVQFIPTEQDDVEKVTLYKKLWDFVWNESDTDAELYDLFLCKNIFGTAFWFEGVHKETYKRFVPKMGEGGKVDYDAKMQTKSWLRGFTWDIRYVWVDPVEHIDLAVDCFLQETDLSREQVENLKYDPNFNADAVQAYIDNYEATQGDQASLRYEEFITEDEEHDVDNKKFSLIHYYNKEKGIYIVTDHKFTHILREGVNPYPHGELPISVINDHKNYKSIYGRGECELLESTKYERNTIRNQIIDHVRESNTINVALGEGVQLEDMELINGVVRHMNYTGDMSQYQYLKPPSMDSGLWNVDNMLQQDATWITGIDNNALVGSPQKTAFEAKLQEQTKLKRIYLSLRLADFFYTRMARQRLANMQFFLPSTTGKKIVGEDEMETRTLALDDVRAEDIIDIDDNGEPVNKGKKLVKEEGNKEFLQLDAETIQSNIDVAVTTPTTTPILKELNKQEMNELFNIYMQAVSTGLPEAQELAQEFSLKKWFLKMVKENGFDPEEYANAEENLDEKKDLREEMLSDLPLPGKPTATPEPGMGAPQQLPGLPPMATRGGNL